MRDKNKIILTELSFDLLDIREVQTRTRAQLVVWRKREGSSLLARRFTVGKRNPPGSAVPGNRLGVGDPVQEVGHPQHGLLGHRHQLVLMGNESVRFSLTNIN